MRVAAAVGTASITADVAVLVLLVLALAVVFWLLR